MSLLVALFAIAAAVWLVPLLDRGRLSGAWACLMVCGVVAGPSLFAIQGPIQFSIDRVLLIVFVAVMAIRWRLGEFTLARCNRLDVLIGLMVLYFLASCVRGGEVPDGSSPLARWMFFILVPAILYTCGRQLRLSADDLTLILNVLLGLGVYLGLTAVFEVLNWRSLVFPRYINDPAVWEFFGRGRGPLMNPAANGMLLTLSLTIAAVRFCTRRRHWKLFYAAIGCVMLAGIYASLTRSCWIGAAAAIVIVSLVHVPRWVRVLGLAAAILIAGGMVMGLKDQLLRMKRDKALSAEEAAKSVELRPLLAIVALEMFKDAPLIGHGYGHYFEHVAPYHTIRSYDLPLENVRPYMQHNVFLSYAVDTGLVGLSMLLGLLTWVAVLSWAIAGDRSRCDATRTFALAVLGYLAAYVINGMFHEVGVIEMLNTFLFALAGLVGSLWQHGTSIAVPRREAFRRAVAASRRAAV